MKTGILLLLFGFIVDFLHCQDIPVSNNRIDLAILRADSLKKGIYRNFEEFQNNNPSFVKEFTINKKNPGIRYNYENISINRLFVADSAKGFVPFQEEYWGLCNGNKIYISYYGKLRLLDVGGKYCQFAILVNKAYTNENTHFVNEHNYILDVTNNTIRNLTVNTLQEILERENLPLLNEYNNERDKLKMLSTYIERLNKTYNYK